MRNPATSRTSCLFLSLLVALTAVFSIMPVPAAAAGSQTSEISADEYYDKTLGGLIGHIAGFLSGYEFVWQGASPRFPLPDNWFEPLNGPYGGNFAHGGDPNYPGYERLWEDGVVASDDDYHVDFFNQHILEAHGPDTSSYDIKEEWKEHYPHDWGAGLVASGLMRNEDLLPPFTGLREQGNPYYWCTEPYIENDTLGMATPGMPGSAVALARKFGAVSGDFEGVMWAEFSAALYALAYTETDTEAIVRGAMEALPQGSWPYRIVEECLDQYETVADWRQAVVALEAMKRNVNEADNVQTLTEVNNAFIVLSLLYGEGDYMETLKIASLAGYDGDCNAATAAGILGVMHGYSGTPAAIKNELDPDGEGVYVNDLQTFFDPYIKLNYPRQQSLSDIAALYQRNAEAMIAAKGGSVQNGVYHIPADDITAPAMMVIANADFEAGSAGWALGGGSTVIQDVNYAHSGNWYGKAAGGGELSIAVSGLTVGETYRLTAYVRTDGNATARLFARQGQDEAYASVYGTPGYWVRRDLDFVAGQGGATIGLASQDGWSALDNISLERRSTGETVRYEAESEQGGGTTFTVTVPTDGEYQVAVNYTNNSGHMAIQQFTVNGNAFASVRYPQTGVVTDADNYLRIPVELESGSNTLTFDTTVNVVSIGHLDVTILGGASFEKENRYYPTFTDETNYLSNGSFENGEDGWGHWYGNNNSGQGCVSIISEGYDDDSSLQHAGDHPFVVYTEQTVNVANGHYTLRAMVKGGGSLNSTFLSAKNFGPGLEQKAMLFPFGDDAWIMLEIPGIMVQNGQITVGFYTDGAADSWVKLDAVSLYREDNNLLTNFDFETGTADFDVPYWNVWPGEAEIDADASYTEPGGKDEAGLQLVHAKQSDYEVFTGQTVNYLPQDTYSLSAWVRGTGKGKHFISIKGHGDEEQIAILPDNGEDWTRLVIRNVLVTTGQVEVGVYSNALAGEWCAVDDVLFTRTGGYELPGETGDEGGGEPQPPTGKNLVQNPSFEQDGNASLSDWGTWEGTNGSGQGASFSEETGYDSAWRLTHYKASAYEVFNGQTLTGLADGTYTLGAWVMGDGLGTRFLSVKNHGSAEQTVAIPASPFPDWVYIELEDIIISGGSCEVGVYSNAPAGSWCSVDGVTLVRTE